MKVEPPDGNNLESPHGGAGSAELPGSAGDLA